MRRAAKKDLNHNEIAEALRKCGFSVLDLSRLGDGCPDMLVGKHGRNFLLEVKRPKATGQTEGKTTTGQDAFILRWRGQVAVVRGVDEALRAVDVEVIR